MLATLEDAVADRWGPVEELLAQLVEQVHALTLITIKANTAKADRSRVDQIKPLRIPRPGQPLVEEPRNTMRPGQFARVLTGR